MQYKNTMKYSNSTIREFMLGQYDQIYLFIVFQVFFFLNCVAVFGKSAPWGCEHK